MYPIYTMKPELRCPSKCVVIISLFGLIFRWDQRLRPNGSSSVLVRSWDWPIVAAQTSSLTSSLMSLYFFCVYQVFIATFGLPKKRIDFCSSKLNVSNWLNYLVYAKSIGELQLWIQRSVSPKFRLSESLSETKNDVTFWLIQTFGLTSNLGLGESLSERLIQKVKLPTVSKKRASCIFSTRSDAWTNFDNLW